jgi:hypothetical protein
MTDCDKKIQNKIFRKKSEDRDLQGYDTVFSTFLQSFWIRCSSVFSNITDRKFMESELHFVLYYGGFFWVLYLLSQII